MAQWYTVVFQVPRDHGARDARAAAPGDEAPRIYINIFDDGVRQRMVQSGVGEMAIEESRDG